MDFNKVLKIGGGLFVVGIIVFTLLGSESNYREQIQGLRSKYEDFLRVSDDSPFNAENNKVAFEGLKYYEPNTDYIVSTERIPLGGEEVIVLSTSSGESRKYIKVALLTFEINEVKDTLTLLQNTLDANDLFLPFTDETSGEETYGAGRQLPVEPTAGEELELDFNRAFNPYCAYNKVFSCPMPPKENHINTRVQAGEKNYHQD